MTVDELKKSGYIIYEVIGGSHAYGTQNADSDKDIRGIFIYPQDKKTLFNDHPQEIADDTQDIKYYELEKFMKLASENNPNIIELLWIPDDCILYKDARMDILLANRDNFVSQKARHTHAGYAFAQIQKAKGKNKKVNNPKPVERPVKEDYCFIIPEGRIYNLPPARPIKITEITSTYGGSAEVVPFDLCKFNCARLEQTSHIYRLYYYGDEAEGVFRGDENLVPESIPLEDEVTKFYGLLIWNEDAYKRDVAEWKSYWEWKNNRNDARWVDQEKGLLDYDQKNLMHCVRLLLSGINILTNGVPIVRFEGEQLEYLRDIRVGKFEYAVIMKDVEDKMAILEGLKDNTKLKYAVNTEEINEIYQKLIKK
jgi:predicted nucleotidyltransferase